MLKLVKKASLASALAAMTLASASPAMAQDYRGDYGGNRHRGGGDGAAIAVGVGIIGLAIAAAAASGSKNKHRRYDRYRDGYDGDGYYRDGYRGGHRHNRDCEDEHGQSGYYDRRGYRDGSAYDRGYDRGYDRNYDRGY